jgi:hypothetical protein
MTGSEIKAILFLLFVCLVFIVTVVIAPLRHKEPPKDPYNEDDHGDNIQF